MKFGIMSKGLAGLGQGLAIAGEMGLQKQLQGDLETQRAEIMARRDVVLNGYENERAAANIQGQKEIHAADRASAERVGMMNKAAHLEGIALQLGAKDNKPVLLPKGAKLIGSDGTVLAENMGDEDNKPITVPEGAAVVDSKGNQLYKNPKDPKADGIPKIDKDIDARVNDLRSTITARMGQGFLERMTEPDRKDFDTLFTRAAKMIREGKTMEQAYSAVLGDLENIKARSGIAGDSAKNPKVQTFRDKYKY